MSHVTSSCVLEQTITNGCAGAGCGMGKAEDDMAITDPAVKPYLKWAGGKRQLLPAIQRHIPSSFTTYYEPFAGAGAVLFALQPRRAVINDSNGQLIETYTVVRDQLEDLLALLRIHQEQDGQAYYYRLRALDRDAAAFSALSPAQRAARLIYLNKTCFNGLYRVNAGGLFNVPYGRYKAPAICDEPTLRAVSRYLQSGRITIKSGDFADAVKNARSTAFVYFDPPYHSADSTNFTGYQAGGFNESEQTRLRDVYARLSRRGVRCLLSNADTPFIRELYQAYTIETVLASRAINANADGRGRVSEVLIKNW